MTKASKHLTLKRERQMMTKEVKFINLVADIHNLS